jgi:imidazole glycerol-phosphate synthase subunit HisF
MLKHRVIPCLLLQRGRLVKTLRFGSPTYVGDPINAVRIFNEKEVDELVVLDISASSEARGPDFELIRDLAEECFMPLAYGGGIRTLDQASRLFDLGVEKVCIQTAALQDQSLVASVASRYGSQSMVASVDVKRDWLKRPKLFSASARRCLSTGWLDHVRDLENAGCGELLLNAVDRDGTMAGIDTHLVREAARQVSIPVVAVGGVGSVQHIRAAVDAGASAVAAGAFFVFHGPHRAVLITYPRYAELEALFSDA